MVYRPGLNICALDELAIHHDVDKPDSKLVFDTYKVTAEMCDRPLFVLLKCFGKLLPAHCRHLSESTAASWSALDPSELNGYLLGTLLGVRFCWVDSLALSQWTDMCITRRVTSRCSTRESSFWPRN